jgi:hypothetical protein
MLDSFIAYFKKICYSETPEEILHSKLSLFGVFCDPRCIQPSSIHISARGMLALIRTHLPLCNNALVNQEIFVSYLLHVLLQYTILKLKKKKLNSGLSPRANYTDRATAACRRSDCQLLRIEGQRDGSLRPYSRFSRQEPLLFYQVAPQLFSRG